MIHISSVQSCLSFVRPLFCGGLYILRIPNGLFSVWSQDCGRLLPTCVLSCLAALKSNGQCMLSINQWLRTNEPNAGVPVSRLLTYRRFSEVCTPDVFLTVSDSYAIIVILPPHFMNYEQWKQKSTLTTLGSTPYKITTFLNEQRNPK